MVRILYLLDPLNECFVELFTFLELIGKILNGRPELLILKSLLFKDSLESIDFLDAKFFLLLVVINDIACLSHQFIFGVFAVDIVNGYKSRNFFVSVNLHQQFWSALLLTLIHRYNYK